MKNEKTVTLKLILTLPDSLAREAEEKGLLKPKILESLLRTELRRRHINHLFDIADRLASINIPPLTDEEIESEILAARTIKHTHACGG